MHRQGLSLMALWLAATLPAQADDAPWLRCAELGEASARLACYDALAASRRARAPVAAAGPATTAAPAAPASTEAARFGTAERSEPEALQSQILGTFEGWSPRTVFTLANGQRWAVADGSSAVLWLQDPKVTVRRAALGGYRIEFLGSNQTARVRRVD